MLGADELPSATTAAIRGRLVAAARLKGRVLVARAVDARRVAAAVRGALAAEAKAAALLGNAPGSPTIDELPIPVPVFGAFDLVVGPDGRSVWMRGPDGNRIVLYPSVEPGTTPTVFRLAPGTGPRGLTFGPGGALYIGDLKHFFLPAGAGSPWGITTGPDKKIWFTEVSAGKVGSARSGDRRHRRVPAADGGQPAAGDRGRCGRCVVGDGGRRQPACFGSRCRGATEFQIPTPNSVPVAIAVGRYGYLWLSELTGGKLLRVSRSGRMREFPLPAGARPYGLVSAPDGNVWFVDRETATGWSRRRAVSSSSSCRTRSRPQSHRSASASSLSPSSSPTRSAS